MPAGNSSATNRKQDKRKYQSEPRATPERCVLVLLAPAENDHMPQPGRQQRRPVTLRIIKLRSGAPISMSD